MKKYKVKLTARYEKEISVYADTPEEAQAETEIVLFHTDLVNFTDEDFVHGEATVLEEPADPV